MDDRAQEKQGTYEYSNSRGKARFTAVLGPGVGQPGWQLTNNCSYKTTKTKRTITSLRRGYFLGGLLMFRCREIEIVYRSAKKDKRARACEWWIQSTIICTGVVCGTACTGIWLLVPQYHTRYSNQIRKQMTRVRRRRTRYKHVEIIVTAAVAGRTHSW